MIKTINLVFILVLCVNEFGRISAIQQSIDHPDQNGYAEKDSRSEKHKYGYELKENKHFHHTTTEEDGVRLGCYGYVLFGKKYSTQYVADVRGYRPVNTYGLINVYPKSGGERKASFIGDFKEDEDKSGNIRYFFPDGCRGIESAFPDDGKNSGLTPKLPVSRPASVTVPSQRIPPVTPNPTTPKSPAVTPEPPRIRGLLPPFEPITERATPSTARPTPPTQRPTPSTEQRTPSTQEQTTPIPPTPIATLPTKQATLKQTPEPQTTTARTTKLQPPFPDTSNIVTKKVPITPDTCSNKNACCEDESMAKLIIPIPLKNVQRNAGSSTCGTFAKLIIPLPLADSPTLSRLTNNLDELNTADLIKSVLKLLG